MQEIIKRDGKFYILTTVEDGEVTLTGLEEKLEQIKAEKEQLLERESEQFDRQIEEVEGFIERLKELQEKPAQRKTRGRKSGTAKSG